MHMTLVWLIKNIDAIRIRQWNSFKWYLRPASLISSACQLCLLKTNKAHFPSLSMKFNYLDSDNVCFVHHFLVSFYILPFQSWYYATGIYIMHCRNITFSMEMFQDKNRRELQTAFGEYFNGFQIKCASVLSTKPFLKFVFYKHLEGCFPSYNTAGKQNPTRTCTNVFVQIFAPEMFMRAISADFGKR